MITVAEPTRTVRLARRATSTTLARVEITKNGTVEGYELLPLEADWSGEAFSMKKDGAETPHHVFLADDNSACDCPAFIFHAHDVGACKHLLALQALKNHGSI